MSITRVLQQFDALAASRFDDPWLALEAIGDFGRDAIGTLADSCDRHPLRWDMNDDKKFVVFTRPGEPRPFSRAMNTRLFIEDGEEFYERWQRFLAHLRHCAGQTQLVGIEVEEVNSLFHSAVIGFGAGMDLFSGGNRKAPGTFLEMAVGPTIAILTGRRERGQVTLPDPGTGVEERIPVDLHFAALESDPPGSPTLVVPTKISTRERISQVFIHQRMLDALRPGGYRSALVACNENNTRIPSGLPAADRTPENCSLTDTLVPGTIRKYQRLVAPIHGMFYTDPPASYLNGQRAGLPSVRTFGDLLAQDLPGLLAP